jgi:predicted membrane protein
LSFCAAVFTDSAISFVVGYSIPFVVLAASNTFALLYSLLNIRVMLFWWGLAAIIFSIGFAGGLLGRSLRKRHARRMEREREKGT